MLEEIDKYLCKTIQPSCFSATAFYADAALVTFNDFDALAFDSTIVGAINTFKTVTFYGDHGYFFAGSAIRYAAPDVGSVSAILEPESYVMLLTGLSLAGFTTRSKK
ncbi:MAG: hypothetical protein WBP13_09105 [Methylophilaceae bacterium]